MRRDQLLAGISSWYDRRKETHMNDQIQIIDRGRGAQLSTSRLTVLDVFYYLHRGYDFEAIHQAMPSLSRAEFDVILG
jgi:hypothetical protein